MNRDEIIHNVNSVLVQGFECDPDKLKPEAHLYFDLGIDSLDAIDMLVFIEEKIGKTVDATVFKEVRKVGDLYDTLEKLLATDGESEAASTRSHGTSATTSRTEESST